MYVSEAYFTNNCGPGTKPWIIRPPNITAATALPGIESVSKGTRDPPQTALLEDSAAIMPSMLPFPNEDGSLEFRLASE